MRALVDLLLPVRCGGCARVGTPWCAACAAELAAGPVRVRPRTDPGVACWALRPYRGPARRAVLAAKEHGRRDLADPLGVALASALTRLRSADRPLVLIPAPTRAAAARRRGGDPVARSTACAARWLIDCRAVGLLRLRPGVRDSVGLDSRERAHNLAHKIIAVSPATALGAIPANAEVVLVDDVLTTGATATESIRVLSRIGIHPCAVLVTCAA